MREKCLVIQRKVDFAKCKIRRSEKSGSRAAVVEVAEEDAKNRIVAKRNECSAK